METQPPPAKVPKLSEDEEQEKVIKQLEERLEKHDENRKAAQDKLHEVCEGLRAQIDELEERINKELEEEFTSEDNRLQSALNELRTNNTPSVLQKAKAELLVEQSYEIIDNKEAKHDLTARYKLKAERRIDPEPMEMRKPSNVHVAGVDGGNVSVDFTCFNPDEERVLSDRTIVNPVKHRCMIFKKGNEEGGKKYLLDKDENSDSSPSSFSFTPDFICAETAYCVRVKMVLDDDRKSEWSDEVTEFTPNFGECCVWKECPGYVYDKKNKYSVDNNNPRIASKANSNGDCTIIGNTYIPLNKVTSWNIKVLESKDNDGYGIYIGIAPFGINQNVFNYDYGWYFNCLYSELYSGPPHKYGGKAYGPRKEKGQYVRTGDSVGVVMDTTKGELSFVLNGVNHGVAYEGIPLDKPLVPCVIFYKQGDSVELVF